MTQVNCHLDKLLDILSNSVKEGKAKPAIVIGAGASFPYPTAERLRTDLAISIANAIGPNSVYHRIGPNSVGEGETSILEKELVSICNAPYMTLENLFFVAEQFVDNFGEHDFFKPNEIIRKFLSGFESTPGNLAVALLRKQSLIGPIVTSNFDDLLVRTFNGLNLPYSVKSSDQLTDPNYEGALTVSDLDIIPFHGTLATPDIAKNEVRKGRIAKYTSPDTLIARGLMRPFRPEMNDYLTSLFLDTAISGREIVFFGYSGQDIFDLNITLGSLKDKVDLSKIHWISFAPSNTLKPKNLDHNNLMDISNFAKSLECNYWQGDFAHEVFVKLAGFIPNSDKLSLLELDNVGGEIRNLQEHQFDGSNLFKNALNFQPDALHPAIDKLVARLLSGFVGAWAVTEHYSLESYGFGQHEIRALGRPHVCNLSMGVSHPICIDFLGMDVGPFVEAQELYWKEKTELKKKASFTDEESLDNYLSRLFPESRDAFIDLQRKSERQFELLKNGDYTNSGQLELGMFQVLKIITLDYLGLMELSAATLPGAGKCEEKLRNRAICLFQEAARSAKEIRVFLNREEKVFDDAKAIKDMVPYLIWGTIVDENAARAISDSQIGPKLSKFLEVVEKRKNLIKTAKENQLDEEATYMLPQAILRCTEAVKAYYDCSKNDALPKSADQSDPHHQTAMRLLHQAKEFRQELAVASALRNRRTATVYDCEIIEALSLGDFGKIPDVVESLIKHYHPNTGINWLAREDIKKFNLGILERLKSASEAHNSQHLNDAYLALQNALEPE